MRKASRRRAKRAVCGPGVSCDPQGNSDAFSVKLQTARRLVATPRANEEQEPLNLVDQQKLRLGACAWRYEEWRGSFYPRDFPAEPWLGFSGRHFSAVEVDSTFYHVPSEATVRRWVQSTPASFRFACKLPRA